MYTFIVLNQDAKHNVTLTSRVLNSDVELESSFTFDH